MKQKHYQAGKGDEFRVLLTKRKILRKEVLVDFEQRKQYSEKSGVYTVQEIIEDGKNYIVIRFLKNIKSPFRVVCKAYTDNNGEVMFEYADYKSFDYLGL